MKNSIIFLYLLFFFTSILAQNTIATYCGNGNYPIWTDQVKWENRIDMKTFNFAGNGCADCASEFSKFEFACDLLYAQGCGVLYYPAVY